MSYNPGLGKKSVFYFSMTLLMIFALGVGLIYQVESIDRLPRPDGNGQGDIKMMEAIEDVQRSVLLAMSAIFFCVIAAMVLFIRNFAKPLDDTGRAAYALAEGRLDHLVPGGSPGEIGRIGEHINALAMNLQEILLYVWNHSKQEIHILDRIDEKMNANPGGNDMPREIREDLKRLRQHMEDMQLLGEAFDLYDVKLEAGKAIDANERVKRGLKNKCSKGESHG